MTLKIKDKKILVQEIKQNLAKAISLIAANYDKITSNKINELRNQAFIDKISIKAVRNNLAKIAFKQSHLAEISNKMHGKTILLYSNKEIGAPARLFKKFNKYLTLNTIFIENKIFHNNKINEISLIPTRKICIATLNNTFKLPIIKLTKTFKVIPIKLLYTLKNIANKK